MGNKQCKCADEISLVEYKDDESQVIGFRCEKCASEWLKYNVECEKDLLVQESTSDDHMKLYKGHHFYRRKPLQIEKPKACEVSVDITPIKMNGIDKLKAGDHISWFRIFYWHHAIVLAVNTKTQTLKVIHWTRCGQSFVVKEEDLDVQESDVIFKINYADVVDSVKLVIARARSFLVKTKSYWLFTNNCETLATFCKT
ncbi:hypothetical protein DPMN_072330 [Dreissena polymorpha]|uniref:LRAT domain-containing protein n=1 Tax=Dreissena polymorpha TaxID=45954 RepID=A0A9D4BWD5_DREPO|nr:hypothetical protein DPMN_072330 [Dreissena polymorpha]